MKHPFISILLASTAISIVPALSYAQVVPQPPATKPSVEVHMDALNMLAGNVPVSAPAVPAPVEPPAVKEPVAAISNAPANLPPAGNKPSSASAMAAPSPFVAPASPATPVASPEARKVIGGRQMQPMPVERKAVPNRLPVQGADRALPRHGSSLFNSRLQPLAPAPAGEMRAPARVQPQIVRIAPPYGAAESQPPRAISGGIVAPVVAAPVVTEEKNIGAVVAPQVVQPEVRKPIGNAPVMAPVLPAQVDEPKLESSDMPSSDVAPKAVSSETETSWWDGVSNSVGSIFDTEQEPVASDSEKAAEVSASQKEKVEQVTEKADRSNLNATSTIAPSDRADDIKQFAAEPQSKETTSWLDEVFDISDKKSETSEPKEMSDAIVTGNNAPKADLATPSEIIAPSNSDVAKPVESVPPIVTKEPMVAEASKPGESAKDLPKNAASYDGLEMAEGFVAGSSGLGLGAPSLNMPPMGAASAPAPQVALPVPTVDENGDEILAQASDGGGLPSGLKDPFQDGSAHSAPPRAPAQPIEPIIPAAPPVANKPEEAPVQRAEANTVPIATPTPSPAENVANKESSWMSDLQESITGYFTAEEKKPETPVAPVVSTTDEQKLNELKTVGSEPASETDKMNAMVGLKNLKAMPENPAVLTEPASKPVPVFVADDKQPKAESKKRAPVAQPTVTKAKAAPVERVLDVTVPPVEEKKEVMVAAAPVPATEPTPAPKAPEEKQDAKAETTKPVVPAVEAKPAEVNKVPEVKVAQSAPVEAKVADKAPAPQQAPEVTVSATKVAPAPVVEAPKVASSAAEPAKVEPPKADMAKAEAAVAPAPKASASEVAPAAVAAVAPAKEVAVKSENQSAQPTQMASLSAPEKPVAEPKSSLMSFDFVVGKSELSKETQSQLDTVVTTLKNSQNGRVNVKAYASAGGVKEDSSEVMAKRISLARGLAIRAYLIDRGVSALRINVQPLGSKNNGGNPERVDVEILTPAGS